MSGQRVTLDLPEAVLQRANQAAGALQHPLEEVLVDMLAAMLPHAEDAPPDMQAELTRMTWLSDQELWTIARSAMPSDQQEQLQDLAARQVERPLTQAEQETLDALRQAYGRATLRKARAYALLSLRGGAPLLTAT
jgi:hypothetical protein